MHRKKVLTINRWIYLSNQLSNLFSLIFKTLKLLANENFGCLNVFIKEMKQTVAKTTNNE